VTNTGHEVKTKHRYSITQNDYSVAELNGCVNRRGCSKLSPPEICKNEIASGCPTNDSRSAQPLTDFHRSHFPELLCQRDLDLVGPDQAPALVHLQAQPVGLSRKRP
jgi:hypothetical protein